MGVLSKLSKCSTWNCLIFVLLASSILASVLITLPISKFPSNQSFYFEHSKLISLCPCTLLLGIVMLIVQYNWMPLQQNDLHNEGLIMYRLNLCLICIVNTSIMKTTKTNLLVQWSNLGVPNSWSVILQWTPHSSVLTAVALTIYLTSVLIPVSATVCCIAPGIARLLCSLL